MIQLLHTEVDVIPGRTPQHVPMPGGLVGANSAVLRITNDTDRQNDYTIDLRCETPYWQASWYRLIPIPVKDGSGDQATVKPDRVQKNGQIASVSIASGKSRDVMIGFTAPVRPDSRAGAYKFVVQVKTEIVDYQGGTKKKERFTETVGTMVIRPFYKWTVEFDSDRKVVRLLRRNATFGLQIKNMGNDWVYCDLKLPKLTNAYLECRTTRVAVPPPDPSNPGSESLRSIPVRLSTKLRKLKGEEISTPITLAVQRVDAPSIPPLADDPLLGVKTMDLGCPVLANVMSEAPPNIAIPNLVYRPAIPSTFGGFVNLIVANIKLVIGAVIGLTIAWNLGAFAYESIFHQLDSISIGVVEPITKSHSHRVHLRGKYILGSKGFLTDVKENIVGDGYEVTVDANPGASMPWYFDIPDKDIDHRSSVSMKFRRAGSAIFIAPLRSFLNPSKSVPVDFPDVVSRTELGNSDVSPQPAVVPGQRFEVSSNSDAGFGPRGTVSIRYIRSDFKQSDDTVLGDGAVDWTSQKIAFSVPSDVQASLVIKIQGKGLTKDLSFTPTVTLRPANPQGTTGSVPGNTVPTANPAASGDNGAGGITASSSGGAVQQAIADAPNSAGKLQKALDLAASGVDGSQIAPGLPTAIQSVFVNLEAADTAVRSGSHEVSKIKPFLVDALDPISPDDKDLRQFVIDFAKKTLNKIGASDEANAFPPAIH